MKRCKRQDFSLGELGCCAYINQLVQEIETQAITAQREINVVKAAVASKQRDVRMLELTSTEVKQLDKDTKVYEGIGKM